MSNKKGRFDRYIVEAINEASSDASFPFRYSIQYYYRRKPRGQPIKLINDEFVVDLLLRFKSASPKGIIRFGAGLELLEDKVNRGYSSKQSYEVTTTPVQSYG